MLFCDLVGSTDLSSRLDPEEFCQLMQCYQSTCAQAMSPFDGHIAQVLGDGLLVYFGYPRAHEDDAVRAVRAALAVVAAITDDSSALTRGWGARAVRIGIHTGLVFAGELARVDARVDRGVVGETPNIAARLQALAEHNEVLIGPRTRSLIEGQFRVVSLGSRPLKGVSAPLEIFRVSEHHGAPLRFHSRQGSQLAPLVGRDRELSVLCECWQRAVSGAGQLVIISGVAGIGKSRLAEAFRAQLPERPRVLVYQCLPYYQNTTLYPVAAQLREAAGIRRREPDEAKLAKLRALLPANTPDRERVIGRWARFLQLGSVVAPELDELSPRRLLDDTIDHLCDELVRMSRARPVLVLVEDAHWGDGVSRRLLAEVVKRIANAPVMIVLTERSRSADVWQARHVVHLQLAGLADDSSHSIIAHLAGKPLPRRVTDEIVQRSDGVPLFVEELTKAVLDGDVQAVNPAVPISIKDSLTARLDRIGPYKLVAQRGACIGSAFSYDMIAFVSEIAPDALATALEHLVAAQLLSRSGELPNARYTFRHSLLQDAVYESMLLQERRGVHRAIAHKLEREAPDICAQEPELLARHMLAAGEQRSAAQYCLRAGIAAQQRSAHLDAIAHLTQGLRALSELARGPDDDSLEIRLQSGLARSYMAGEGWLGPRVHAAFTRARELARAQRDVDLECELLWGLCAHWSVRGELDPAVELAREYVELAERASDPSALLMADSAAVLAHGLKGEFAQAQQHAARIHARYAGIAADHLVHLHNHDPLVLACVHESYWLWLQGQPDRALEASQTAVQRARELRHSFNLCYALCNGCCVRLWRGEIAEALAQIDEALAHAQERRIPIFKTYGPLMGAPALVEREGSAGFLHLLERSLAVMRASEVGMHMPLYLGHVALAYRRLGKPLEASAHVEQALAIGQRTAERWLEPELLRLRAGLQRDLGGPDDVCEAQLWAALDAARVAAARGFQLRIACDLTDLLEPVGRGGEAVGLVAELVQGFDEGLGTRDLLRAQAQLRA